MRQMIEVAAGIFVEVSFDYTPAQKLPAEPFPVSIELDEVQHYGEDILPLLSKDTIIFIEEWCIKFMKDTI